MTELSEPILITGATGFIGGQLAERLIAMGIRPRLLARNPSRLKPAVAAAADIVVGDLADLAALRVAVRNIGTIFHCAANVNTWDRWENYLTANVDGVRHLLQAMEHEGVPRGRFVHLSSVDVYGFPALACDEAARSDGGAFGYGRSKALGEKELRDGAERLNLSYVILRPTNVIGPHGQFIHRIGDELRSGLMLKIDHGGADCGFLYIDNLLDCLLWAASASTAEHECFNVSDPEPIAWARFIADFRTGIGGRGLVLDLPYFLADAAGRVLEVPSRLLGLRREPLLHRLLVRIFGRTCGHDTSRLAAAGAPLGAVGYAEAMRRSVAWYREAFMS
jgi:nucleoside-diphosphate-sugar epimerase